MSSRLEMHHYETIVAVSETGSVTAAAGRLHVSQSAVSHRLAEAERRLGGRLFERRPSRGMQPTPAALALCQAAHRAMPDLARAERDFMRSVGGTTATVRIGVGSYDCYHWLAQFATASADRLEGLLLELVVVGDAPVQRLADGTADLVLAPGPAYGSCESRHLFTDELVLITHPEHRLADRTWIGPEAVAEEDYFTYNRQPSPGFEYERFLRPAGVSPRTITVLEQTGAIAEMIAADFGVSILSRWAMSPWLDSGRLVAVRCSRSGLDLEWSALTRIETDDEAPERQVAAAIVDWLGSSKQA
ncbi:LysR family transcriptional regulator [Candidatus Poriferisodalis sp.]|uniref:LysR family transcriptional regulator n=1 Tax=Candidatus Poriferisodalis sp. TaxID=3101277 RepID=UPI003B01A56A